MILEKDSETPKIMAQAKFGMKVPVNIRLNLACLPRNWACHYVPSVFAVSEFNSGKYKGTVISIIFQHKVHMSELL